MINSPTMPMVLQLLLTLSVLLVLQALLNFLAMLISMIVKYVSACFFICILVLSLSFALVYKKLVFCEFTMGFLSAFHILRSKWSP